MFRTELEFVRWLRERSPRTVGRLKLGIGDDAALVKVASGHDLILTTDMSIEGVHFTRSLHPPRSVGHRALARSLSDIAAMGGEPRFALVSLAVSRQAPRGWVGELYQGMLRLANRFRVGIIGGDTAVVPTRTMIDVMVTGEVPPAQALTRAGAQPGDQLFVSGRLGLSALGLQLLQAQRHPTEEILTRAIKIHLYPEPQCALGRFLARKRLATALIDLSDGLSTDLHRLCQASGVGARLWVDRIPQPEWSGAGRVSRVAPLDLALHGGEDYQLLFSVPPRRVSRIPRQFRGTTLYPIGEIRSSREVVLTHANGENQILPPSGYDHFRTK